MKSLQELIDALPARIEIEKEVVRKLANQLLTSDNPGYYLSWSQDSFQSGANIEVYTTILKMAKAVASHTDEQWLEYAAKDMPPVVSESRFEWFKRYVKFTAVQKMSFSHGSLQTANLHQHCLNSAWRDVATNYFSIWA